MLEKKTMKICCEHEMKINPKTTGDHDGSKCWLSGEEFYSPNVPPSVKKLATPT